MNGLDRLGKPVRAREGEILNFHLTNGSNGRAEAQNLITGKIRIGHGFRTFANYAYDVGRG